MPRKARSVIPGFPHHVTQRGNNRQCLFLDAQDFHVYLGYFGEDAAEHSVEIVAYCIMPNHIHAVATPPTETALSRCFGTAHRRYAKYFNAKYDRTGHAWEGRFYSCVIQPERVEVTLRYVERNPVRARLATVAWEYPWSSAAAHTGGHDRTGLLDIKQWSQWWLPDEWTEVLMGQEEEDALRELRDATRLGRPYGSARFARECRVLRDKDGG